MGLRTDRWTPILALALIGSLTLYPTAGHPEFNPWCIACGDTMVIDALLNVLLFVPFGFTLGRNEWKGWAAILVGCAVSVAIECAQLWIPGRDPSVRDVLTNTLGAAVGWWASRHAHVLIAPSTRQARVVASCGAALWLAAHAFGDWAGLPALPAEPYDIGYIGRMEDFQYFPGRVLGAAVNDVEITKESVADFERNIRTGWAQRGTIGVSARVIPSSEETAKFAPIVGVADSHHRQIFLLGQEGSSLAYRLRARANDLRLRGYLFELDGAFPGRPGAIGGAGDTLFVEAERKRGGARLVARSGDRERVIDWRLGPALVWTQFLFFDLPIGPSTNVGSALWLFLSLLPIGYWAAAGVRNGAPKRPSQIFIVGLLALLPIVALGVFAVVFSLSPAPIREWLAALGGLVSGWWLWFHARRRRESARNQDLLLRGP